MEEMEKKTVNTRWDLWYLIVRMMDDFLEVERIKQCFEGVKQWQKEEKYVQEVHGCFSCV